VCFEKHKAKQADERAYRLRNDLRGRDNACNGVIGVDKISVLHSVSGYV
jgi:hypothetical protein